MADRKQRELERGVRRGDALDPDRWIAERLRSGDISLDEVRFAAYLGHQAAQRATGIQAPEEFSLERRLRRVVRAGIPLEPGRIERLENVELLRAWALDCAEHVLPLASPHEGPLVEHLARARRGEPQQNSPTALRVELAVSPRMEPWRASAHRVTFSAVSAACATLSSDASVDLARRERDLVSEVCWAASEVMKSACEAVLTRIPDSRSSEQEAAWQVERLLLHLLDLPREPVVPLSVSKPAPTWTPPPTQRRAKRCGRAPQPE